MLYVDSRVVLCGHESVAHPAGPLLNGRNKAYSFQALGITNIPNRISIIFQLIACSRLLNLLILFAMLDRHWIFSG